MTLQYARDVEMHDVEIAWEEPHAATWQSGLVVDDVEDLLLDGARFDAAPGSTQSAMRLNNSNSVTIRHSRIGSVHVTGSNSKDIRLVETALGDGQKRLLDREKPIMEKLRRVGL